MTTPGRGWEYELLAPERRHAAVNILLGATHQRGVSVEALTLAIRDLSGRSQFPAVGMRVLEDHLTRRRRTTLWMAGIGPLSIAAANAAQ